MGMGKVLFRSNISEIRGGLSSQNYLSASEKRTEWLQKYGTVLEQTIIRRTWDGKARFSK